MQNLTIAAGAKFVSATLNCKVQLFSFWSSEILYLIKNNFSQTILYYSLVKKSCHWCTATVHIYSIIHPLQYFKLKNVLSLSPINTESFECLLKLLKCKKNVFKHLNRAVRQELSCLDWSRTFELAPWLRLSST